MTAPRPLDAAAFRAALARFASGVTVLTLRGADGRDHGMTATAFSSLSLDPPLVLVCVGQAASIAPAVAAATHFAIHLLSADQETLARRFSEKDTDRFEGISLQRGIGELPLLDGALARLQCRVRERHPGGDHQIVVGEVLNADAADGDPLLYYHSRYAKLAP